MHEYLIIQWQVDVKFLRRKVYWYKKVFLTTESLYKAQNLKEHSEHHNFSTLIITVKSQQLYRLFSITNIYFIRLKSSMELVP